MSEAKNEIPEAYKAADKFENMRSRLYASDTTNFNGAFLIVPPTGDAKELILYSNQDAAIFWGLLKTTAEMALNDLAQQEANQMSGFGRR